MHGRAGFVNLIEGGNPARALVFVRFPCKMKIEMSLDIHDILNDWPYEPGRISARRIRGDDGKDKIQLRLDLGLLQMEVNDRPDGQRPHGFPTRLDYYRHLRDLHEKAVGEEGKLFSLDERACELLRNEAVMYYHRYLAKFILEEYAEVIADTDHNLALMEFCATYAGEESDRYMLEQYRPYVLMMRTRSEALLALNDKRPKSALRAVKKGQEEIAEFYRQSGMEPAEHSSEVMILNALAKEIEENLPPDPVKELREKLLLAVEKEHYEEAANLRDQLRRLTGNDSSDEDGS